MGIQAKASVLAIASVGSSPSTPLLAAELAAREVLKRANLTDANSLQYVELHDAFAVQGLSFAKNLSISADRLNAMGGGVARGHPIGASAAIALVQLLANLERASSPGALGLAAVAGAGGLGAAAVVTKP